GERVELGGWTFGFIGGGLRSPYRTPNEIGDDEYAAKVAAVGAVDVLCAHIRRTQPRYVLFGHVHQPLARRVRIGRSECINVGHFRATRTPCVLAHRASW